MRLHLPPPIKLLIKLAVSACILILLVRGIAWNEFLKTLRSAHPLWLTWAAGWFALSKYLSASRFLTLVRIDVPQFGFRENLILYWKGMYYNLLLPGGISGDAYKMKALREQAGMTVPLLIRLVLADRISGVIALVQWAALLLLLIPGAGIPTPYVWMLLLFTLLMPLFFLYFVRRAYQPCRLRLAAYSLAVQSAQLAAAAGLVFAVGQEQHLVAYLALFLGSSLATLIPFTIGGAGARELVFMYGAPWVGGQVEPAVAIGFLFYLISTGISLLGIFLVFHHNRPPHANN